MSGGFGCKTSEPVAGDDRGKRLYEMADDRFESSPGRHIWIGDEDFDAVVELLERSFDLGYLPAGYRLLQFYATRRETCGPRIKRVCYQLVDVDSKNPESWLWCVGLRLKFPITDIPGLTKDRRDANRMFLATAAVAGEYPDAAERCHDLRMLFILRKRDWY